MNFMTYLTLLLFSSLLPFSFCLNLNLPANTLNVYLLIPYLLFFLFLILILCFVQTDTLSLPIMSFRLEYISENCS
jgi:hypothetical protein